MKTKLFTLLLAVAASVGTMFAEPVQIGDLYYNFDATNQTAEVTSQNSSYPYWSTTITTANIPASVTYASVTYSVTSIGDLAFLDCSGLTSLTIPNSVTSIGFRAFEGCTGLTSVTIGNSVTSIGKRAFCSCSGLTSVIVENGNTVYDSRNNCNAIIETATNTLIAGCMNTTIPNSVTSIGNDAFYNCRGLTSVTIGNSVTSIGDLAFFYCSGLTSLTIPNSVTSIGNGAFEDCRGLTSIEIPNSVTSIGGNAFNRCSSLTSVTIPNSVTSIGGNAFNRCSSLTSVTIPNSVTSIGDGAFFGCSGLTSLSVEAGNTVYDSRNNCNAIIKTSTNTLIFGCQNTTIPNSVTSIGDEAFYKCSGLTSVTIPNSVTSIGSHAFRDCTGLTSVTIPNSVTNIGNCAFEDCSGLTSVTIEAETPPTLGKNAFYNTNSPIYVPCGTLDAYKTAWSAYASRIKYRPAIDFITTYAKNGYVDISAYDNNTNATICDGELFTLTPIPNNGYHFTQWSDGLKDNPRTIELTQDTTFTAEFAPDRVGTCGKDLALVWSYDPTNKVLTIGNVGSFTENMHFGLEAPNEMEELVIGNSVTAIGENAFAGIETLKKVSIGESVKTIYDRAFYNCVNLETIFNYRPTPTNAYSTAFDGVDKFECKLYVLPSSIDMYKNASVWRDFYYKYAIGAEETTVTTNDVTVEPQNNAVTVTWPTSNNAATYTIQITKDGVVFCTLIFNANGQLTGIAFAPSREGSHHAPAAIMTANGLQFTVTGLDSGTHYALTLQAKDSQESVLASYSSEFTTTGDAQSIEEVPGNNVQCTKVVRNGQIFILRGDKTYTLQGQEVK